MQTNIPKRPRGRPFERGHRFGHRFYSGDPWINYDGRPPVSDPMRRAYEQEMTRPFPPSEIVRLPRWLRPHVRAYANGETLNFCEVLAVAVGTLAASGNIAAAREIRLASEGPGVRTSSQSSNR